MYNFKDKIEDYTEREFIELLGELYGGGVYDIDNLRIVTPRLHDEIHYRR